MRAIPDNNLAYPVLIKTDKGSGSGFLLQTDSKDIYLITAKHVLVDENEILRSNRIEITCQTADINDFSVYKFNIDLQEVSCFIHRESDVASVFFGYNKDNSSHRVKGITRIQKGNSNLILVDQKNVKILKNVLISNDVFLYGYPTSLGLKNMPQFDYNRPLLRKGIVANTNPVQGTIILDCPVYFGNSGGPVVEVEKDGSKYHHKIIGVVSQFIPFVQEWINPPTKIKNKKYRICKLWLFGCCCYG